MQTRILKIGGRRSEPRLRSWTRILAVGSAFLLPAAAAFAAGMAAPYVTGSTPTIDGQIQGDAGWALANHYDLQFDNEGGGGPHMETVYLKHDANWLYIGLQTHFADAGWNFWAGPYIDGNGDGLLTANSSSNPTVDLSMSCAGPSAWSGYNAYWWLGTGTDGQKSAPAGTECASSGSLDVSFEYKISLADMGQAPGGTFGLYMLNGTNGGASGGYEYPAMGPAWYFNAPDYARVQLGAVPEPFTTVLCAAGLGLAFARRRKAKRT